MKTYDTYEKVDGMMDCVKRPIVVLSLIHI